MKKSMIVLAVVLVCGSIGAGYFALQSRQAKASHKSRHQLVAGADGGHHSASGSKTKSKSQKTSKQAEAAGLTYFVPTGKPTESISTAFDQATGRTRMTVTLRNLSIAGAGSYKARDAEVRLTSSFKGTVRKPTKGEASVDGAMSVHSNLPGLLAPSVPPGTFQIDGQQITTRRLSKSGQDYTSARSEGGVFESLAFKLDTRGLLALGAAPSARARFGLLEVTLSPAQIADLREFAARMNPSPPGP